MYFSPAKNSTEQREGEESQDREEDGTLGKVMPLRRDSARSYGHIAHLLLHGNLCF